MINENLTWIDLTSAKSKKNSLNPFTNLWILENRSWIVFCHFSQMQTLSLFQPLSASRQGTTCLPSGSFSRSIFQCSACRSCQDVVKLQSTKSTLKQHVIISSNLSKKKVGSQNAFIYHGGQRRFSSNAVAHLYKSDHFSEPPAGDFLHPWTSHHHIACNPVAVRSHTRPTFCPVQTRSQHSKSFQFDSKSFAIYHHMMPYCCCWILEHDFMIFKIDLLAIRQSTNIKNLV